MFDGSLFKRAGKSTAGEWQLVGDHPVCRMPCGRGNATIIGEVR